MEEQELMLGLIPWEPHLLLISSPRLLLMKTKAHGLWVHAEPKNLISILIQVRERTSFAIIKRWLLFIYLFLMWCLQLHHPSALEMFEQIIDASKGKQIVMFLDYDGTLSPIVDDPDKAFMSKQVVLSPLYSTSLFYIYIYILLLKFLLW